MTERQLLEEIHKAHPDARLFRNDNGEAWTGTKSVKLSGGRLILQSARRIRYGLQPGSADLIGWTPVVITPDMVGQTVAVFTSIEAKTENDRISDDQIKWWKNVRKAGGIAKIIHEIMGAMHEIEP